VGSLTFLLEEEERQQIKVAVVVPVLNQFELAVKSLESIRFPNNFTWQPIIINNWSHNNGVAAAWNLGCKKAIESNFDYIMIINDDIVCAPHTPFHMVDLLSDKSIGVITATDHRNSMTADEVRVASYPSYETEILDAPDFACFMLTPESYKHIGQFDENLYPAYFEDNDYCYRSILSGLQCVRSQNSVFYHHGSQTQKSGEPVVPSEQFEANRDYYTRKWGGVPGEEVHSHPWNDYNLSWLDNNPTI
jgi:hypothetical protein